MSEIQRLNLASEDLARVLHGANMLLTSDFLNPSIPDVFTMLANEIAQDFGIDDKQRRVVDMLVLSVIRLTLGWSDDDWQRHADHLNRSIRENLRDTLEAMMVHIVERDNREARG